MSDQLDLLLLEELRPVKAPEELWRRVNAGRRPAAQARRSWMTWRAICIPALAAFIVLIAALSNRPQRNSLENLAARELASSENLDLHSGNNAEISAWLRKDAGVDLRIPSNSKATLRGARVIRQGDARIGEVAYTVGGNTALLLVAAAGGSFDAPTRHGGVVWQSGQQVYAISSPVAGAGCALCHTNL